MEKRKRGPGALAKWRRRFKPYWKNFPLPPRVKRERESIRRLRRRWLASRLAVAHARGIPIAHAAPGLGLPKRTAQRIYEQSRERVWAMSELEIVKAEQLPAYQEGTQYQRAVDLRKAGKSYQAIAAELDIPEQAARLAVHAGLTRLEADEIKSIDLLRRMEVERLDSLLEAIWPRAIRGELDAMAMVLKLADSRARRLGLDAPLKVDMEAQVRLYAQEHGLDAEVLIRETETVIRSLPA